ncbi:galectin-6 [Bradysia coprophila]|uniref:galectin-6 n=1 Tax=Bradysia coprophila TaxID=38358 RepID=UPI00187D7E0F|nr:galectin-6 [Bradysia coprophila]
MKTEFVGNIAFVVETGHIFVISGQTLTGAERLDIDLKSGKHDDAPIPLQLSVRFTENAIVRNTYRGNNEWFSEERDENRDENANPNPLVAGERFQVYIFVGENNYYISVNKEPFCKYSIRAPIEDIRTISVTGDLEWINQVDHRSSYPYPHPLAQKDEKDVAFSNDVPSNFQAGHVIVATAIPYGNIKGGFVFAFRDGATDKQVLHFNARFRPEFTVVRNAMNDKNDFETRHEERSGGFPFKMEEQFKLAIAFTPKEFMFAVNGVYFNSFQYRTNRLLDKISGLKIFTYNGFNLEITSIDHVYIGHPACKGFEQYSHPDIMIF